MGHASQQSRTQSMTRRGGGILAAAGTTQAPNQIRCSSLLPCGVAGNAYKTP